MLCVVGIVLIIGIGCGVLFVVSVGSEVVMRSRVDSECRNIDV